MISMPAFHERLLSIMSVSNFEFGGFSAQHVDKTNDKMKRPTTGTCHLEQKSSERSGQVYIPGKHRVKHRGSRGQQNWAGESKAHLQCPKTGMVIYHFLHQNKVRFVCLLVA